MPAETAWRGLVVALVVFVVLASGNLVKSAEGMPLGWQRSVSLVAATSIDRLANLFSLNRPYDWAAVRLGIQEPESDAPTVTTTTTPASTTTTALPPVRVPTADAPLRILVAGDSTSQGVGNQLKASASETPELAVDVQGKVATGLTRSDYFDWVARTQELITQYRPEVYMFMVGANDQQSVLTPDGEVVALYGQPGWEDAYRERVAQVMDLARGDGRRVVWVGEPNVGNPKIQEALTTINRVAREEARRRDWVEYFDLAKVVAGPDGGFADYVDLDGKGTVKCFAGDGVHLSSKCLQHTMTKLIPFVQDLYGGPAPSTTTTSPGGRAGPTGGEAGG
ncbi:MAG: DUF459 domain-containing protein [Actinomycetes bacterium]